MTMGMIGIAPGGGTGVGQLVEVTASCVCCLGSVLVLLADLLFAF